MLRIALLSALGPILWGTTYSVFTETLPTTHPFFVGALRALPGGLILLALNPRFPPLQVMMRYAVLAFFNMGLFFALLFIAAARMPGGMAATLGAIQPLVVIALVAVISRSMPYPVQLIAGFAGIAGVALLVLSPGDPLDMIGVMAALGGTVSMAIGTVLIDHWGRDGKPLEMATWQLILGGLILLPFGLVLEGLPPVPDTKAILGYAWLILFGTAFGYYVWNRGITKLGPSAAYLALMSPVVATLIGTLFLGETFGIWQWVGIVLVIAAIVTGVSVKRRVPLIAPQLAN